MRPVSTAQVSFRVRLHVQTVNTDSFLQEQFYFPHDVCHVVRRPRVTCDVAIQAGKSVINIVSFIVLSDLHFLF